MATHAECENLFNYFKTPVVQKALLCETRWSDYVKSIIRDGSGRYLERSCGPDDRCITGDEIHLYNAKNPEEIAEYVISGLGFRIQRIIFNKNSPFVKNYGQLQGIMSDSSACFMPEWENAGDTFGDRLLLWIFTTHSKESYKVKSP